MEEALWRVVACPRCHADRDTPCRAPRGNRVEAHAERIAARQERDRAGLAWYAAFVAAADPVLAAHGYEPEERRVEGGWAHWRRDEHGYLAARLGSTPADEPIASLDGGSTQIPAGLRDQLVALGARAYCPECGSYRRDRPTFTSAPSASSTAAGGCPWDR